MEHAAAAASSATGDDGGTTARRKVHGGAALHRKHRQRAASTSEAAAVASTSEAATAAATHEAAAASGESAAGAAERTDKRESNGGIVSVTERRQRDSSRRGEPVRALRSPTAAAAHDDGRNVCVDVTAPRAATPAASGASPAPPVAVASTFHSTSFSSTTTPAPPLLPLHASLYSPAATNPLSFSLASVSSVYPSLSSNSTNTTTTNNNSTTTSTTTLTTGTATTISNTPLLLFQPLHVQIDVSFWKILSEKKLREWRLETPWIPLLGVYTAAHASTRRPAESERRCHQQQQHLQQHSDTQIEQRSNEQHLQQPSDHQLSYQKQHNQQIDQLQRSKDLHIQQQSHQQIQLQQQHQTPQTRSSESGQKDEIHLAPGSPFPPSKAVLSTDAREPGSISGMDAASVNSAVLPPAGATCTRPGTVSPALPAVVSPPTGAATSLPTTTRAAVAPVTSFGILRLDASAFDVASRCAAAVALLPARQHMEASSGTSRSSGSNSGSSSGSSSDSSVSSSISSRNRRGNRRSRHEGSSSRRISRETGLPCCSRDGSRGGGKSTNSSEEGHSNSRSEEGNTNSSSGEQGNRNSSSSSGEGNSTNDSVALCTERTSIGEDSSVWKDNSGLAAHRDKNSAVAADSLSLGSQRNIGTDTRRAAGVRSGGAPVAMGDVAATADAFTAEAEQCLSDGNKHADTAAVAAAEAATMARTVGHAGARGGDCHKTATWSCFSTSAALEPTPALASVAAAAAAPATAAASDSTQASAEKKGEEEKEEEEVAGHTDGRGSIADEEKPATAVRGEKCRAATVNAEVYATGEIPLLGYVFVCNTLEEFKKFDRRAGVQQLLELRLRPCSPSCHFNRESTEGNSFFATDGNNVRGMRSSQRVSKETQRCGGGEVSSVPGPSFPAAVVADSAGPHASTTTDREIERPQVGDTCSSSSSRQRDTNSSSSKGSISSSSDRDVNTRGDKDYADITSSAYIHRANRRSASRSRRRCAATGRSSNTSAEEGARVYTTRDVNKDILSCKSSAGRHRFAAAQSVASAVVDAVVSASMGAAETASGGVSTMAGLPEEEEREAAGRSQDFSQDESVVVLNADARGAAATDGIAAEMSDAPGAAEAATATEAATDLSSVGTRLIGERGGQKRNVHVVKEAGREGPGRESASAFERAGASSTADGNSVDATADGNSVGGGNNQRVEVAGCKQAEGGLLALPFKDDLFWEFPPLGVRTSRVYASPQRNTAAAAARAHLPPETSHEGKDTSCSFYKESRRDSSGRSKRRSSISSISSISSSSGSSISSSSSSSSNRRSGHRSGSTSKCSSISRNSSSGKNSNGETRIGSSNKRSRSPHVCFGGSWSRSEGSSSTHARWWQYPSVTRCLYCCLPPISLCCRFLLLAFVDLKNFVAVYSVALPCVRPGADFRVVSLLPQPTVTMEAEGRGGAQLSEAAQQGVALPAVAYGRRVCADVGQHGASGGIGAAAAVPPLGPPADSTSVATTAAKKGNGRRLSYDSVVATVTAIRVAGEKSARELEAQEMIDPASGGGGTREAAAVQIGVGVQGKEEMRTCFPVTLVETLSGCNTRETDAKQRELGKEEFRMIQEEARGKQVHVGIVPVGKSDEVAPLCREGGKESVSDVGDRGVAAKVTSVAGTGVEAAALTKLREADTAKAAAAGGCAWFRERDSFAAQVTTPQAQCGTLRAAEGGSMGHCNSRSSRYSSGSSSAAACGFCFSYDEMVALSRCIYTQNEGVAPYVRSGVFVVGCDRRGRGGGVTDTERPATTALSGITSSPRGTEAAPPIHRGVGRTTATTTTTAAQRAAGETTTTSETKVSDYSSAASSLLSLSEHACKWWMQPIAILEQLGSALPTAAAVAAAIKAGERASQLFAEAAASAARGDGVRTSTEQRHSPSSLSVPGDDAAAEAEAEAATEQRTVPSKEGEAETSEDLVGEAATEAAAAAAAAEGAVDILVSHEGEQKTAWPSTYKLAARSPPCVCFLDPLCRTPPAALSTVGLHARRQDLQDQWQYRGKQTWKQRIVCLATAAGGGYHHEGEVVGWPLRNMLVALCCRYRLFGRCLPLLCFRDFMLHRYTDVMSDGNKGDNICGSISTCKQQWSNNIGGKNNNNSTGYRSNRGVLIQSTTTAERCVGRASGCSSRTRSSSSISSNSSRSRPPDARHRSTRVCVTCSRSAPILSSTSTSTRKTTRVDADTVDAALNGTQRYNRKAEQGGGGQNVQQQLWQRRQQQEEDQQQQQWHEEQQLQQTIAPVHSRVYLILFPCESDFVGCLMPLLPCPLETAPPVTSSNSNRSPSRIIERVAPIPTAVTAVPHVVGATTATSSAAPAKTAAPVLFSSSRPKDIINASERCSSSSAAGVPPVGTAGVGVGAGVGAAAGGGHHQRGRSQQIEGIRRYPTVLLGWLRTSTSTGSSSSGGSSSSSGRTSTSTTTSNSTSSSSGTAKVGLSQSSTGKGLGRDIVAATAAATATAVQPPPPTSTTVFTVGLRRFLQAETIQGNAVDLNVQLIRWRVLPQFQPQHLQHLRVLLLGAGTLGCGVARLLVAWGLRHLTLVDAGTVALSNPARQSLYTLEDAAPQLTAAASGDGGTASSEGGAAGSSSNGMKKAEVACKRLLAIRPDLKCRGVPLEIPMPGHTRFLKDGGRSAEAAHDVLCRLIDDHDVVLLLTDSKESRWLPSLIAAERNSSFFDAVPWADGDVATQQMHWQQEKHQQQQESQSYGHHQKQQKQEQTGTHIEKKEEENTGVMRDEDMREIQHSHQKMQEAKRQQQQQHRGVALQNTPKQHEKLEGMTSQTYDYEYKQPHHHQQQLQQKRAPGDTARQKQQAGEHQLRSEIQWQQLEKQLQQPERLPQRPETHMQQRERQQQQRARGGRYDAEEEQYEEGDESTRRRPPLCMAVGLGFDSMVVMRHGYGGNNLGCYFCNALTAPADSLTNRTLDQQCTVTRPGISSLASGVAVELLAALTQHPLGFAAPHSVVDPLATVPPRSVAAGTPRRIVAERRVQHLQQRPQHQQLQPQTQDTQEQQPHISRQGVGDSREGVQCKKEEHRQTVYSLPGTGTAAARRAGLFATTTAPSAQAPPAAVDDVGATKRGGSCLGATPHTVRGYLSSFRLLSFCSERDPHCVCCSNSVLQAYRENPHAFLRQVLARSSLLETISGLAEMRRQLDEKHTTTADDVICLSSSDNESA